MRRFIRRSRRLQALSAAAALAVAATGPAASGQTMAKQPRAVQRVVLAVRDADARTTAAATAVAAQASSQAPAAQPDTPSSRPDQLTLHDLWPAPPVWDLSAFVGWRAVRVRPYGYPAYSNRLHAGLTGGYYWTPHVKTEVEVGTSTQDRFETYAPIDYDLPGLPYRPPIRAEHTVRDTAVVALLALYQFGEDAVFHPNLGIGIEMTRTRDLSVTQPQSFSLGSSSPPVVLVPEQRTVTDTNVTARGLLSGGFKLYATPRLFVRADARVAIGSSPSNFSTRIGAGFDF